LVIGIYGIKIALDYLVNASRKQAFYLLVEEYPTGDTQAIRPFLC
jgi:hypothetical protein